MHKINNNSYDGRNVYGAAISDVKTGYGNAV